MDALEEAVKSILADYKNATKYRKAIAYKCKLCGFEDITHPPMGRPSKMYYHLINFHTKEVLGTFTTRTLKPRVRLT